MMIVCHSVFKEQKKHQRNFMPAVTGLPRWSDGQAMLFTPAGQPLFLYYFLEQFPARFPLALQLVLFWARRVIVRI